jgi:hypothetical protein
MEKILLLIIIYCCTLSTNAQIIPSTCIASDSVKNLYQKDADRLAVQKFFRRNLDLKDTIEIPKIHSDTILNALIAVYNLQGVSAKDTVVSQLNLHTFHNPFLDELFFMADSNLSWMQQFRNGSLITGNSTIDSLLSKLSLNLKSYSTLSWAFAYHMVVLHSNNLYNIIPLTKQIELIPGVQYSGPQEVAGSGDNILDSIHTNHVELTYVKGWGDCHNFCINERFWKFKVYFDCTVEYMGSYGSTIDFYVPPLSLQHVQPVLPNKNISVSPNPFLNSIKIEGINESTHFIIKNIMGQTVMNGAINNGSIDNLQHLQDKIYVLHLSSHSLKKTLQILNGN